jgi:hypothetical protein
MMLLGCNPTTVKKIFKRLTVWIDLCRIVTMLLPNEVTRT